MITRFFNNGWWFLLPACFLFAAFSWNPILQAFETSLKTFTGEYSLAQYGQAMQDPYLHKAAANTGRYLLIRLAMGFALPIVLAIGLHEITRGRAIFRAAYLLPMITSLVLVAMVWKWAFNPQYGLFNVVLKALGLPAIAWLNSEFWVLPSLATVAIWNGLGYWMLIYLAALQGIPDELYEAAAVDGATPWKRLLFVTLPQLKPIMKVCLILTVIAASQLVVEPMVMTEGGPNNSSLTLSLYVFYTAFRQWNIEYASAITIILFLVLLVLTAVQLRFARR